MKCNRKNSMVNNNGIRWSLVSLIFFFYIKIDPKYPKLINKKGYQVKKKVNQKEYWVKYTTNKKGYQVKNKIFFF